MTSIKDRVKVVGHDQLEWGFRSDPGFIFSAQVLKGRTRGVTVDPFPCYPHSPFLVEKHAHCVEALWSLDIDPMYYLPKFEDVGRTNATTYFHEDWSLEHPAKVETFFVLSGKRTPPHTAMTEYLVYHEYGHAVQRQIQTEWSIKDEDHLLTEYAALRKSDLETGYGGGRWHKATAEIFANDFRIIVCGVQPEFWPHPETSHPSKCWEIPLWWHNEKLRMLEKCKKISVQSADTSSITR